MPQATIKISRAEFKDALHIPDGCTITGISYDSQTDTVDVGVTSPRIPDIQPTPVVVIRYRGFMKRTVYELQDQNGAVLDEWAKYTPI